MTDVILSPVDVVRVEEHVHHMELKRQCIRPAVDALHMTLGNLTDQYNELGREIAVARASIAPIRNLPLEMLSMIFEFCTRFDINAPFTLVRICRKWRMAAKSPQVWSRIVVDLDDPYAEERTAYFLKKSRNAPLDVELVRSGFQDEGYDAWYLIRAQVHRWRSLEVSTETYSQANQLLKEFPQDAPNLTYATFIVGGIYFIDPNYIEFPALALPANFVRFPKFRSLRLQTWSIPILNLTQDLKFTNLTTLYLTDTNEKVSQHRMQVRHHPICGNAIAAILRQCPRLVSFTLDARDSVALHSGRVCQDPSGVNRGDYAMSALQNISLIGHHLDIFAILDRLTLPSLTKADIQPLPQYAAGLSERFSRSWRDLVRRSKAPPLEELDICAMAPEDFVWTLEHSPRMKKIRLAYCANPTPIIKALASPYSYKGRGRFNNEPRWVSPKLNRFYLEECFRVSWTGVARLLKNRHNAYMDGRKLTLMKELVVNGHHVFENRDLDSLTHFKVRQIRTLIEP
ncbi:hypothetical protein M422DRAFT_37033 [Sphaerobolus stellatus SS14]|uniref:F-box domain-containing protein n=1 Tax=Sphaerobolus stellatus (strain SS14) TaxID=990650 RepID=A0A0C9U4M5_SPHS4|nr:hypothetical protein M422DRAFT_37033 [Sphaerobolus stellatus SS14]